MSRQDRSERVSTSDQPTADNGVRPRLSVLGTGYLGATHAVCMTELGYDVIGLDVDESKVTRLNAGEVPFFEPGLGELLRKALDTGRLRFTTSIQEVADSADVHFVCVGTPQKKGEYAADVSYVEAAFGALAPLLRRPALIVGKSTVPAGTAQRMSDLVASLAPVEGVEVAWNPEFLREGFAVEDTLRPDRLVFGVNSAWAEQQLRIVFAPAIDGGCPVVVTDYATAELVKVAANSFLATKISFINAMAEVCEVVHADVTKLSEALGYDDRIGRRFLNAGLGFGGGCLPKDIRAFMARAGELGADQALTFLKDVDAINMRRRARTVDLGRELLSGSFHGHRVAVWGAAFKPNSDDIRDSPALDVAVAVQEQGATVLVYDPAAMDNARRSYPQLDYSASALDAARDADLVLLLTEWTEFREMDPAALGEVVAHRRIVDGRNALEPTSWRGAGWTYRALGRP
jgi:UDPglucose 6-dehydrogenase